jgi:hypothetical protein
MAKAMHDVVQLIAQMLFFQKKTCSLKFLPSKFPYSKICSIVQLEAAFQALSIFLIKKKTLV